MHQQQINELFMLDESNLNPYQIATAGTVHAYGIALASCVVLYVPEESQSGVIAKLHDAVSNAVQAIVNEPNEEKIVEIQANAFTDFFTNTLAGFFKGLFTKDAQAKIEIGISSFITTDLGQFAMSAVEYVQAEFAALPIGASTAEKQANSVAKRDAAVAKLKADAAAAGKDLSAFAQSTLIWFIETALQAVVARGLAAAAGLAVHV